jgi:hypothetical protein
VSCLAPNAGYSIGVKIYNGGNSMHWLYKDIILRILLDLRYIKFWII